MARVQAGADGPAAATQSVAVPAYIHPSKERDWEDLLAQDSSTVRVLVANVADGPGTAPDPAWQRLITRAVESGKRVLGYVDTGYLGSDAPFNQLKGVSWTPAEWAARAERDARRWHELYTGIGGIFLDDATWACGPMAGDRPGDGYASLYRSLNGGYKRDHPDHLTVLNPGVNPQPCMRDAADVFVSWEGTADRYLGPEPFYGVFWDPPPAPDRFWHIVYDTPADRVDAVLARSRERGAGWVYVTDDRGDWRQGGNPFDDFPLAPYWDRVVSGVSGRQSGQGE